MFSVCRFCQGLNLSLQKILVVRVNEGFDFLGFHSRRRRKRGADKWHPYTYPSRKSLRSLRAKVRGLTCRSTTSIPPWLRKRHPRVPWRRLARMYMQQWRIVINRREIFCAASIPVTRYRYRGTMIPTPWTPTADV